MGIQLLILLIQIVNFNCFNQIILNCDELDLNTNTCIKCKDKHFPIFHDLYCLPCNDKDYGQIGCEGNCDSSKYENERLVYCEINSCKEGFYELDGFCLNCSDGSPGCKTCYVNEIQTFDGNRDYEYICQECLSNEYKMNEYGICEKCQMDGCQECIFNNSKKECLKCQPNYYLTSNKTCKQCYYSNSIPHGDCIVCSDNYR